jgi:hypothetical protein
MIKGDDLFNSIVGRQRGAHTSSAAETRPGPATPAVPTVAMRVLAALRAQAVAPHVMWDYALAFVAGVAHKRAGQSSTPGDERRVRCTARFRCSRVSSSRALA